MPIFETRQIKYQQNKMDSQYMYFINTAQKIIPLFCCHINHLSGMTGQYKAHKTGMATVWFSVVHTV